MWPVGTRLCGALVLASPRWGWAALPLVILAPPMAWLDWRRQGWLVAPGTVPKTSSGKLQRSACRAQFVDGSLARLAEGG